MVEIFHLNDEKQLFEYAKVTTAKIAAWKRTHTDAEFKVLINWEKFNPNTIEERICLNSPTFQNDIENRPESRDAYLKFAVGLTKLMEASGVDTPCR